MREAQLVMYREAIALDGAWQVVFDHDNCGRRLGMERALVFFAQEEIESVAVPSCLEEYRQDYEGVAWYHRGFRLDPGICGSVIRLAFGAVNYRAEVWLNGEPVGYHEGGYTGFTIDVTEFVTFAEENHLIVRVITPLITRDVVIDGLGRDEAPHWRGAIAGGIWQSVSLLVGGAVYLDRLFVRPLIHDSRAEISATLGNTKVESLDAEVSCVVTDRETGRRQACWSSRNEFEPGETDISFSMEMRDYALWSPDEPTLCVATIEVRTRGAVSHRESVRFGMREFTVDGGNFVLNGEPFRIKGAFYEGLFPHSLAFPRDIRVLKRTFQNAKDGGLNLIRPWRKPQPPVVYDLADEMGLLMVGSIPVECMDYWPQLTPQIYSRIDVEIREMVTRDRNHASIVLWEMFNELWRKPLIAYKHKACRVARGCDPDRLILDEAGGFAGGASVYPPGSRVPVPINDVHRYPGAPLSRRGYDFFLHLAEPEDRPSTTDRDGSAPRGTITPGLLTNVSEIGYGSVPNLSENWRRYQEEGNPLTPDYRTIERLYRSYVRVLNDTGIMAMFGDLDSFVDACQTVHANGNRLMIEACRLNPQIAGIMVHALTGGDWVVGAGLLDIFGEPKRSYYGTRKAFEPRYLAITPGRPNLVAGDDLKITIRGVNDLAPVVGRLSLVLTDAAGTEVNVVNRARAELPRGISRLGDYCVETAALRGLCTVRATLGDGTGDGPLGETRIVASNEHQVYIMEPYDFHPCEVAILDESGSLGEYAAGAGYAVHDFAPGLAAGTPLFVSGTHATDVMRRVASWVEAGGDAVILDLPQGEVVPHTVGHRQTVRDYLPFDVVFIQGHDLWSPSSRIPRDHELFGGIPTNAMMDTPCGDIAPRRSIVSHREGWISAAVFYHYYGRQHHKQNYLGVSEADYGADLVPVSHGRGAYYLCTLQIARSIGTDRFAQRLFWNLARCLGSAERTVAP